MTFSLYIYIDRPTFANESNRRGIEGKSASGSDINSKIDNKRVKMHGKSLKMVREPKMKSQCLFDRPSYFGADVATLRVVDMGQCGHSGHGDTETVVQCPGRGGEYSAL